MSRRTVRRTYQRALSLILASTLAASVGAVAALPAAAVPAATATATDNASPQQEETAPDLEEPGFFRGLVQGIAQAFSDPGVTGPAEDSGWEEYLPDDPTGRGWEFVEPITDDYHENYFRFENAHTQVPDLFDFSASDLTNATALDPVEGVSLHINTVESEAEDIDVEWLTEGVDYLNDRGPEDGVIANKSATVELEISVESGPARTLRIVAPQAGVTNRNFCVSALDVGIVAQRVTATDNACDFHIPHGVTWTGGRSLTTNVTGDSLSGGRGVVPFLTNAGNAVSRPVSYFRHFSVDAYAINGEINTETGEGFFQMRTSHYSGVPADLIIHAEDFPVGTRFSYGDQVVERTADTSDLTLRGVNIVASITFYSPTYIDFQIPEDSLPTGSVSEAGRYDVGFSLVNVSASGLPQNSFDEQWFLESDSKLFYNIGDGTDYGSFEDKDTLTTQHGLSAVRSVGGFVNNNWVRVSWVEPIRIKGSTSKELLAPQHLSYGTTRGEYSAVVSSQSFTRTGGDYVVRSVGGESPAEATPGTRYTSNSYGTSNRVAHDTEMFSVVTYQAETYGPNAVGVGTTIAVCDVWGTYDYHYDDSRDMLVPDGVEVYYSTSPRVTQGPTPGSNSRTAQCGDYSDTSVWSTDKPEDMSSVTGVVTTLAITEELLEDSGDVVTLYAGAPVIVPPYFEGGPVAGDTLPDWYAATASTEFGTTRVASTTIVTPNADPIVVSTHKLNTSSRQMRGETASYTITSTLYDAHHPYLTGPLVVTDVLPRCLEAVTVSEETLAYYEITAWRNKGEAVCGDDSSPQEEIELTLRPGVEESKLTLDYPAGDRYSITVPPIDVTATISRTAPNQSMTNVSSARYVRVEDNPVNSTQSRSYLYLIWVADTGLVKTVDQAIIEPGEPVTWTLSAINETSSKAGDTTFIDIFPHDGIAWDETILGETWGNDFDGALNITDVRVVYGAGTGVDVSYTSHDPTLLDPDNSHQEGVDWVSDVDAIGGYGNVTAIKVFIPNFGDEGSEIVQVRVSALPENMTGGESIVNKLSRGHADNIHLDLPDPQPVRTDVVTSAISGTVWHDEDRDALLDSGESGLTEAEVTLCRMDGGPGARGPWTQTTGEDGTYAFEDLNSGNYKVSLNGCEATEESTVHDGFPMSHLDNFEQTFSYANRRFEDAAVVADVVLGKDAAVTQVNFGFYSEDDARGIAFAMPDTGDGAALWMLLLLTGGAAAGVAVFLVRRHRMSGNEEVVTDRG